MANRGSAITIPIWVRAPGIIALVLIGVLISPILLDSVGTASRTSDRGGGHSSGEDMEMERNGSDHGSRDETERDDGDHGSGDESDTDDGGHG